MIIAVLVAAIAGAVLGVGVTMLLQQRREHRRVATTAAAATDASTPRWSDVVDRLSLGVVVSGGTGQIHYRNQAARGLAGTHMGVLVDDTVERLLSEARGGEEVRQRRGIGRFARFSIDRQTHSRSYPPDLEPLEPGFN